MTEQIKTVIEFYFLLPDFKSRGHPHCNWPFQDSGVLSELHFRRHNRVFWISMNIYGAWNWAQRGHPLWDPITLKTSVPSHHYGQKPEGTVLPQGPRGDALAARFLRATPRRSYWNSFLVFHIFIININFIKVYGSWRNQNKPWKFKILNLIFRH